jgi:hypothetical protein
VPPLAASKIGTKPTACCPRTSVVDTVSFVPGSPVSTVSTRVQVLTISAVQPVMASAHVPLGKRNKIAIPAAHVARVFIVISPREIFLERNTRS